MSMKVKVEVNNISKHFTDSEGNPLHVLKNISFAVYGREFVCIVGPSGCGKTTLLRVLAGLEQPSSGTVLIGGMPPNPTHGSIGFVFQEETLFPWRTVWSNIRLGLELREIVKEEKVERIKKLIRLIKLEGFEKYYPYQLSVGMRQRVALARTLAIDPTVLLMDEPFASLDAQTRNLMQEELLRIWEEVKKTVLFVTHSVDEAVYLADRIIVLSDRPAEILGEIKVDIPRTRDRLEANFIDTRRMILDLLHAT